MSVFPSTPHFIFSENSFNSCLHPDVNFRQILDYLVTGNCSRRRLGFSGDTRMGLPYGSCSLLKLLWETSPGQFKNQLKPYGVPDMCEHVKRTSPSSDPGFRGVTGLIYSASALLYIPSYSWRSTKVPHTEIIHVHYMQSWMSLKMEKDHSKTSGIYLLQQGLKQ